jgi:hypothetical protein
VCVCARATSPTFLSLSLSRSLARSLSFSRSLSRSLSSLSLSLSLSLSAGEVEEVEEVGEDVDELELERRGFEKAERAVREEEEDKLKASYTSCLRPHTLGEGGGGACGSCALCCICICV